MRGQIELPALGVAFLLLTGVVLFGISVATTALDSAERSALERHTAAGLSERLVGAESPLTTRENVVGSRARDRLNRSRLRAAYELPADTEVRIRLGGETLAQTGSIGDADATTVTRLVLVEERQQQTLEPDVGTSREVTLPRRTRNTTLRLDPPAATTIRRVFANEAVLLANESGLRGRIPVSLSPLETTTLRFEVAGPLPPGSVAVTYEAPETRKATLTVTADG